MRRCLRPTSTKSGSRFAAQTAAKCPMAQMARPSSRRRRPRPPAAVHDRDGARSAAEQDMLGQRPMDRDRESRHRVELFEAARHQMSAPPPNEKNDRKKLDAEKAMLRPKTIWIMRRKPPEVSPNASARPVAMMTMAATIFATDPSMD